MGIHAMTTPFPWARYSKKLIAKIDQPRCAGFFTAEESEARLMRLAVGTSGQVEDGNTITFFWLVDVDDGIIVDAKFQAFGQSALIAAGEVTCELLVGKNYEQAKRISTTLIDQQVRDRSDLPAFPPEASAHLNLALEAVENAAEHCADIPLLETYSSTPIPQDIGEVREGGYPGWLELSQQSQIAIIEEVLNQDVRPYIALDAGGVEIVNLLKSTELHIAYQGSCTSCYSSVGSTLAYIQQILRAKVHPDLIVIPQ